MSDYYIGINQNSEPYIAHAWGKRGANQSHKYIAKIGEGVKARYFYTQEELRAFQQGGRQKAQNAVNKVKEKASDTAGRIRENSTLLNVGNQYRAAQRAHQNSKSSDPETAKWGKKGYDDNNTLGGKAYKAKQRVKDFVEEQKSKDTAENLFRKKYGIEPKKVHETIIDTPGDKFVRETKEKLKSTSDRMKEEFRKTKVDATNAKDSVREKLESIKKSVKDLKKNIPTPANKEEKRLSEEYDKADRAWNKAYDIALKAQEERSNLQWENVNGEWRKRKLTPDQQKNLSVLKEREEKAVKELDRATKDSHAAFDKLQKFRAEREKPLSERVSDKVGVTAKEKVNEAEDRLRNSNEVAKDLRERRGSDDVMTKGQQKLVRQRESELAKAEAAYKNTPLGKAESAVKSLKDQVKDIIPGAKISGNKLVMPSGNKITIPEQYITEEIIPETFLKETVLREEVLTDDSRRKKK